jgi:hypothetical protein
MEQTVCNPPDSPLLTRRDATPPATAGCTRLSESAPTKDAIARTCRDLILAVVIIAASVTPARAQWTLDTKDGKASLRFGFLAQPQLEVIDTPDNTATTKNIFLRRVRILFGGKVSDKWTFFFETDSPNLGKATAGVKDSGSVLMQDAFVTYNCCDAFKVDAGLILTPLGHNHLQSAATLLAVDYGPYTFLESTPTGERVGRDYGAEVRGYPAGHFEYRLGVFQGVRGLDGSNQFRVAGRAVYYPFAADTGFFYGGTWQGTKRIVALGASFDKQKEYSTYGADAFVEQPFDKGAAGVTVQFDWMRFDGGTFLTSLPRQNAYLLEAAVHLAQSHFSPLVQYATRNFTNPLTADTNSLQAGAAFWMAGHTRNVKFTAGRLHTDGKPNQTQVLLQLQIFFY